jgi:hypothetical protein
VRARSGGRPRATSCFRFHTAKVRELGGYLLGRRLYETMLVWETDPSLRETELRAAFADVWRAIPKVVFSRTLDSVQGNARLRSSSVAARRSCRPSPKTSRSNDRVPDVRLAGDLRALPARPRWVGLTPPSESSVPRRTGGETRALADGDPPNSELFH